MQLLELLLGAQLYTLLLLASFSSALVLHPWVHNSRRGSLVRLKSEAFSSLSSSSLQNIWERALMQQRAGAMQEAMAEYELLISAATSSGAPPESLAEVYTNLGQLKAKSGDRSRARELFKLALDTRSLATAHTNLALLDLAEGGSSPGMVSVPALRSAKEHCERALVAEEKDDRSISMETKILEDCRRALREET